jgi:ABC-2 type transport system permease protein
MTAIAHHTTTNTVATAGRAIGLRRRRVVAGEWLKLRATQSTWWSATLAVLGLVGAGVFAGIGVAAGALAATEAEVGPLGGTLAGVGFAEIVVAVLGILAVTGDYATGAIRTTFTAVPSRTPVVLGKAAAVAGLVAVVSFASIALSYVGSRLLMASAGLHLTLDPSIVRALAGTGLYLTGIAVIGLSLGWLLRSTAGALGAFLGLLYGVQVLSLLLPQRVAEVVVPYLPSSAGAAIMRPVTEPGSLSPWMGLTVFAAYAVIGLAAAAIVVRRRDA